MCACNIPVKLCSSLLVKCALSALNSICSGLLLTVRGSHISISGFFASHEGIVLSKKMHARVDTMDSYFQKTLVISTSQHVSTQKKLIRSKNYWTVRNQFNFQSCQFFQVLMHWEVQNPNVTVQSRKSHYGHGVHIFVTNKTWYGLYAGPLQHFFGVSLRPLLFKCITRFVCNLTVYLDTSCILIPFA